MDLERVKKRVEELASNRYRETVPLVNELCDYLEELIKQFEYLLLASIEIAQADKNTDTYNEWCKIKEDVIGDLYGHNDWQLVRSFLRKEAL